MNHVEQESKTPILLIIFLKFLGIVFPIFTLLKLNRLLNKANKIYPNSWFIQQKRNNLLVGLIVSAPFLLGILVGVNIIAFDATILKALTLIKKMLLNFDFRVFKVIFLVIKNDTFQLGLKIMSFGILVSAILGIIVKRNMKIINDSNKLKELLQKNGVFEKNDNTRIALATPVGFLIDITGSSVNELKHNERIWMALNLKIKETLEDPEKRSLVFFKKAYELKNEYIYHF